MIKRKKKTSRSSEAPVSFAQARKTTFVVAGVLALVALWNLYQGRATVVMILATISLSLLFIGLLLPAAAIGFHRFWMAVAGVLGYVNSRILLSLLYYGLFTPYGIVSRVVGRDPLQRRKSGVKSYWVKRSYTRQSKEQFEHLF